MPHTIRIGDADYVLEFTMREALEYERRTGRSFFKDLEDLQHNQTAEVLIGLLWCAIVKNAPQITIEEVAGALTIADLDKVLQAFKDVYVVPFAGKQPDGGVPPSQSA